MADKESKSAKRTPSKKAGSSAVSGKSKSKGSSRDPKQQKAKVKSAAAKKARKGKRTKDIEQRILKALSEGTTLVDACKTVGIHPSAWRVWCRADSDLDIAHARARNEGFDAIADDCLRIANEPVKGEEIKYDETGKLVERKVSDMLGHRKLQIETRLKLLAKWDPKRYGEKLGVEHSVGETMAEVLAARRKRAKEAK